MSRKTITLAAVAAAASLVVAAPAGAATGDRGPTAHASGDPAPPIIPSLIQTRITRVGNAIDRLTEYVDDGDTAGVDRTGKVIRRQLAAAWRGATYYVKNPPPPVAEEAQESDDAAVPADPATAAFAVFETYHSVAATVGQLIDGARVPILDSMSHTLFWTLDSRDKAIAAARTLEPPVDPEAEVDDEVPTFATVMPGINAHIDDEMRQIRGLQADAPDLTPGGTRLLTLALGQNSLTQSTVNTYWPPEVED